MSNGKDFSISVAELLSLIILCMAVGGLIMWGFYNSKAPATEYAELSYGYHSPGEPVDERAEYGNLFVAKRFGDGCLAWHSEGTGWRWMEYKHPVEIINMETVYLDKQQLIKSKSGRTKEVKDEQQEVKEGQVHQVSGM